MSDQQPTDSRVLKFVKRPSAITQSEREELANLIRTVLAPSELFKMCSHRQKRTTVTKQAEILKFEPKTRLTGN